MTEHRMVCPQCGSTEIVYDYKTQTMICTNCGLVVEERIPDISICPASIPRGDFDKRVGSITYVLHDNGLSSTIGLPDRVKYQHRYKIKKMVKRLRKISCKYSLHEKSNIRFMQLVYKLLKKAQLPRYVIEEASRLAQAVFKEHQRAVSRDIEKVALIIACAFSACKEYGIPVTLRELMNKIGGEYATKEKRKLRKTINRICNKYLYSKVKKKMIRGEEYIKRYCMELKLPCTVTRLALEIYKKMEPILAGRNPSARAAGVIYTAAKLLMENITQKQVANVAGVTEVSVRNIYKTILDKLDITVNM